MPSRPLNKQYLKLELPKGFLDQFAEFPKSRVAGAVIAATGAFLLVRVVQKTLGDLSKQLVVASLFFAEFFVPGLQEAVKVSLLGGPESLIVADPAAASVGLIVGGMILAGQNPGEVLKGIGEIIPG